MLFHSNKITSGYERITFCLLFFPKIFYSSRLPPPLFSLLRLASSVLPVNLLKDAKTQMLQSWRMTKPHNCPLIHFEGPVPPLFSTIDLFTNSQKKEKRKIKIPFAIILLVQTKKNMFPCFSSCPLIFLVFHPNGRNLVLLSGCSNLRVYIPHLQH